MRELGLNVGEDLGVGFGGGYSLAPFPVLLRISPTKFVFISLDTTSATATLIDDC